MAKTIDARGRSCPEPVILVQRDFDNADSLSVLVDNSCAVENITRFCEHKGGSVAVTQKGDEYTLTVTKP